MKEILKLVSVAEYEEFRKRAMESTGWNRTQYSDRKIGRTKLTFLERKELLHVVQEMHREESLPQTINN